MKGLTTVQAGEFLKQYGLNTILEQKKKSIFIKFFEQFNNFLTLLLILASFFSFLIGEQVDGILIISIVILNALFGIYQEKKAEDSVKVLKKMTVTKVRVIRDGSQIEIDSQFLVPGDLVYLEEGAKVPADGVICENFNLEINESALTGESMPVIKAIKEEVFSGTIVAKGRGLVEIKKTGMNTKFGQIAKNLSLIDDGITPLQKKLKKLTRLIGIFGIVISIVVFVISKIEGIDYFPAFLLSVSLAVAVVPEGLPAVMTITLALGMKKMADKKAVVKKLSAIEALGSITLIATDKTGTLTENKMKVKEIYIDGSVIPNSFRDLNEKMLKQVQHDKNNTINLLLLDGILCSTASLVYIHDHSSWDVLGDPTEGSLLYLAQHLGIDYEEVRKSWKIIDERPFDSVTKMMSVVVKNVGNDLRVVPPLQFTKGAPESILNICDRILINGKEEKMSPEKKKTIENQVSRWASRGLRVLAFSYSSHSVIASTSMSLRAERSNPDSEIATPDLHRDRDDNMVFLGMVAIHDSPRSEINEAIKKATTAGIKVVMITGDNEKTAEAIGVSCGLIKEGDEILTGIQLDQYDDQELLKILPRVKIFARTSPFQKHRIVKLYQELGEIVAVTGDGVNDAIALKQADVGVAMGLVGTDVARETADMIITDDNFASIISAVEEGRNIINHLKNAIKYLLSCNVSEAIALIIGLILGLPALFYPIQLLYINLVTDGIPALMLSFSPRDPNLMSISPQKEMVLLKKKDQSYILLVGLIGAVIVVFSYFIYNSVGLGKTAAFSILTMIQSFVFVDLWLSHRPLHKNIFHLFSPLFVLAFAIPVVLQFIILSHPFSAAIFKIRPVSPLIFLQFLLVSLFVLAGIRVVKKVIKL